METLSLPWGLNEEVNKSAIEREVFSLDKQRSIRVERNQWSINEGGIHSVTSISLFGLPRGPQSSNRVPLMILTVVDFGDGRIDGHLLLSAKTPDMAAFIPVYYDTEGNIFIAYGMRCGYSEWRRTSDQIGVKRRLEELPAKIDFSATVDGFLKQVQDIDYSNPVLVPVT